MNFFVKETRKLYCPCKNEGTCLKSDTYAYKCQCQEGYFGTYCQYFDSSYKFVDNSICKNGGVRTQLSGLCSCLPGFFGSQCEYQSYTFNYPTTTKDEVNYELRSNIKLKFYFIYKSNIFYHFIKQKRQ